MVGGSVLIDLFRNLCLVKNKSIPVVQWNNDQATTMQYQPFVLLLHKLGFQLPADAGSIYARIPDFWTPEMMYLLAKKLGPLDKCILLRILSRIYLIFEFISSVDQNRCRLLE